MPEARPAGVVNARMARTVPFGPTMTACCGSTWRHRDGPMWPRFKQAATRRGWSGVGPDLADIRVLCIKVGPVQAVRVGPHQAVIATRRSSTDEVLTRAERARTLRKTTGNRLRIDGVTLSNHPRADGPGPPRGHGAGVRGDRHATRAGPRAAPGGCACIAARRRRWSTSAAGRACLRGQIAARTG
jgi:hypothetical protein